MTGLPTPLLTVTIHTPRAKNALGDVTIHEPTTGRPGAQAPARKPGTPVGRANRPHHCTRCGAAGHNSRSRRCPARSA